ncbi:MULTISPECIES: small acid-soluble spore protein SspI [unclassified Paenibacillus]|uniref:Small, acid-soluble spore protein I n=1 Tax=Paenibacillus provencensis TaxID=441151 RepID=A0ABW3Q163_9BACL|nr:MULTISPECIES: small acid-soluble spore protein SspI [unclassified Paenibacillus]MCM3129752.1 small acid-soluble spore protein SspI [Paenibacillus sp. MER 78]SFS92359.1 small acid-soluble spore protein I (minor) [Paenibacillus sp. 453mf]
MSIVLDLRQAIVHKVHGKPDKDIREMIEGSVDGPEAALPGLGTLFEMIWKDLPKGKQDELIQVLQEHLKTVKPVPLT